MDEASLKQDYERAASFRDRLTALCHIQSRQGINPHSVKEADVFAAHQEAGQTCIQVFFFRTGNNWGNRAYFPRADKSVAGRGGARSLHRPVLRRQAAAEAGPAVARHRRSAGCSPRRLSLRAGHKIGVMHAGARREARAGRACADQCARGAGAPAGRVLLASRDPRAARRAVRSRRGAGAHRGLRQQPHLRHQSGRRHDRRRARKASSKGNTASST